MDIAERMIAIGKAEAEHRQLENVRFSEGPVEYLPFPDGELSLVMCRAAYHHFVALPKKKVVDEIPRCYRIGGRIVIQYIIAYSDPDLDAYVEELELAIDSSHCRTLPKEKFVDLFTQAGLDGIRGVEFHIRLDLWPCYPIRRNAAVCGHTH